MVLSLVIFPLGSQALVKSLKNKVDETERKSGESNKLIEEQVTEALPTQELEATKEVAELSPDIHELPVGDNEVNNKLAEENKQLRVCIHTESEIYS